MTTLKNIERKHTNTERKITTYLSIVLYILRHLCGRFKKNLVFSPFSSDSMFHLSFSRVHLFCSFALLLHICWYFTFQWIFVFTQRSCSVILSLLEKLHWRLQHSYCFYLVNRMHWHCFIHGYCADRYCVTVMLFLATIVVSALRCAFISVVHFFSSVQHFWMRFFESF